MIHTSIYTISGDREHVSNSWTHEIYFQRRL
nr:MAG TPA: hypothetical protein [Caudoviricetes sp.]